MSLAPRLLLLGDGTAWRYGHLAVDARVWKNEQWERSSGGERSARRIILLTHELK